MKTFFLLSDLNIGIIISGVFGIVTLILTLVVIPLLNKIITRQAIIHSEINGMKDELIQSTKELGEAVGKAQGRADVLEELKAVEIKDNEVVIRKNLDK